MKNRSKPALSVVAAEHGRRASFWPQPLCFCFFREFLVLRRYRGPARGFSVVLCSGERAAPYGNTNKHGEESCISHTKETHKFCNHYGSTSVNRMQQSQ